MSLLPNVHPCTLGAEHSDEFDGATTANRQPFSGSVGSIPAGNTVGHGIAYPTALAVIWQSVVTTLVTRANGTDATVAMRAPDVNGPTGQLAAAPRRTCCVRAVPPQLTKPALTPSTRRAVRHRAPKITLVTSTGVRS